MFYSPLKRQAFSDMDSSHDVTGRQKATWLWGGGKFHGEGRIKPSLKAADNLNRKGKWVEKSKKQTL